MRRRNLLKLGVACSTTPFLGAAGAIGVATSGPKGEFAGRGSNPQSEIEQSLKESVARYGLDARSLYAMNFTAIALSRGRTPTVLEFLQLGNSGSSREESANGSGSYPSTSQSFVAGKALVWIHTRSAYAVGLDFAVSKDGRPPRLQLSRFFRRLEDGIDLCYDGQMLVRASSEGVTYQETNHFQTVLHLAHQAFCSTMQDEYSERLACDLEGSIRNTRLPSGRILGDTFGFISSCSTADELFRRLDWVSAVPVINRLISQDFGVSFASIKRRLHRQNLRDQVEGDVFGAEDVGRAITRCAPSLCLDLTHGLSGKIHAVDRL